MEGVGAGLSVSSLVCGNLLSLSNKRVINLDESASSLSGFVIKFDSRMSRHNLKGLSNLSSFLLVGFLATGASSEAEGGAREVLIVCVGGMYNKEGDVLRGVVNRFLLAGQEVFGGTALVECALWAGGRGGKSSGLNRGWKLEEGTVVVLWNDVFLSWAAFLSLYTGQSRLVAS